MTDIISLKSTLSIIVFIPV